MSSSKEIIVVSPEKYTDLARKLAHEISKFPGCNGAFWTVKKFEDNEFQLGGNRYAILLGNSDENILTKDFLKVIKSVNNQSGVCYGYDGAKAVIFGEGKLDQEKAFRELLKSTKNDIESNKYSMNGIEISAFIVGLFVWYITIPLFFWRRNNLKVSKILLEQTQLALILFLANNFDSWIGMNK